MRPHGSAAQLQRRRRRAIALLRKGCSTTEAAARVGADPSSVRRWRQALRRRGEAGLNARPHPGRPCLLSGRQKQALVKRLLKGARANGFSTDLWTCPRIVELIEARYGVRYHVDHIPRLMASLGFSGRKPDTRARERDAQAIRQ
ncbi:MAG: winged helix-turn-helix domain-containing protein [Planctomycetota bacterium]|nr:winged helix-turn-helix domain-containing protein [Planctomycetota bacterium]